MTSQPFKTVVGGLLMSCSMENKACFHVCSVWAVVKGSFLVFKGGQVLASVWSELRNTGGGMT
jgi:hypothetical protein